MRISEAKHHPKYRLVTDDVGVIPLALETMLEIRNTFYHNTCQEFDGCEPFPWFDPNNDYLCTLCKTTEFSDFIKLIDS